MKDLSQLLLNMPSSATVAVSDKANALRAAGRDIIALAGGDPNFRTAPHIIEAGIKAIQDGYTNYPAPSKGIVPTLEAIADKVVEDSGVQVNPLTDIVITPGGKWGLALALRAILNPGDEVLCLEPVWVSYPPLIQMSGGVPVMVNLPSDDNFRITAAVLEAKVTPKTKALMLTSPSNPTGRVLTQAEADVLTAFCIKHDLYLIHDELYEKLIFDGRKHIAMIGELGMAERTFMVNGLSKAYAMTGWRLGWVTGPTAAMKLAAKMHSQTVTAAAHFTMYAAIAALKGPQDAVEEMRLAYQARRDFMVDALNELPGIECASIEGAFYLFPKFTHSQRNSLELAEFLLDETGIAATPGIAFGSSGEGHLRFSIATAMSDLERAVELIAGVAERL
ncbi:MAG: pyridoxal phosphate-dependent aminotransferase [Anaerolineales bacterium]|nr:pyridoxal phosphate-dependent aminotransferase [Anaerolineales bacterium]